MSALADRLIRLAKTQRRIANQYAAWVREGGNDVERCAREAARLRREARWHIGWARRERGEA